MVPSQIAASTWQFEECHDKSEHPWNLSSIEMMSGQMQMLVTDRRTKIPDNKERLMHEIAYNQSLTGLLMSHTSE